MKRIFLILAACLILLSACGSKPTPTQPVVNFIASSVAGTLTALPPATSVVITSAPGQPSILDTPVPPTLPPVQELPSPTPWVPTQTPYIIYVVPTAVPPYIPPTYTPYPFVQTPAQFIYYYFSLINNRKYDVAWSFLTPNFIAHNNPDGYLGYMNYWNTVSSVVVTSVYVQSIVGNTANVTVYATYNYLSGTVINTNVTYYLIYDYYRATWLFESPN